MAYHHQELERNSEVSKLNVSIEELDLSSFGDTLVPADIVDVIDGGVVLESKVEFSSGTLLRIDFCPVFGNGDGNKADEVVLFGYVKESREGTDKNTCRMRIVFERLKNDKFGEIAEGLKAV